MTVRMIERWFPCAEVSEQSAKGWGRGLAEKSLFTWFASRPLAQAKAAVICSLLPWPENTVEQERLKTLVRKSMNGYDAANRELREELARHYPNGAKLCDPFSGRAMIPLEAARLGVETWGIDYSPVATLAGHLLADWPMRNWDNEPDLPFDGYDHHKVKHFTDSRLLVDVRFVLDLAGERYETAMGEFYPTVGGKHPWGYVWATTLPCTNCGARFPLTGNLVLRKPGQRKGVADPGQHYRVVTDPATATFHAVVENGTPVSQPTLVKTKGRRGKTGVCCFCQHPHPLDTLRRLMSDGLGEDVLLVVADHHPVTLRHYRTPTRADIDGLAGVEKALEAEPGFGPGLPAVPNEKLLPALTGLIGPAGYGYDSWGGLCNARQTLGFVRLTRIVDNLFEELSRSGISSDYAAALTSYAAANIARRLKYSTRSATLQVGRDCVAHIYLNESGIGHSFDYFETGCGTGPGTWPSMSGQTVKSLTRQLARMGGRPATIQQGSATTMPLPNRYLDAVVTDPPYDKMINYCDSSDLLFVWLKRALMSARPWFGITADPNGLQEKTEEAVIARVSARTDHRTETHYKKTITKAFTEARLKTRPDGVISIVFGHGDPDAWTRVLTAIADAGLVLTGSWPCSTEKGGKQTGEHIDSTIVMATRAAAPNRPDGDLRLVAEQIRAEIADRVPMWVAEGLAGSDRRMAAIGPAMEIVGRYRNVRDFTGQPVPIDQFLGLARRAVEETANARVDQFHLADFDERTRFALTWARRYGRETAPGSAVRWQRLSCGTTGSTVAGLLVGNKDGQRLVYGNETGRTLNTGSAVIDVALGVAGAGRAPQVVAGLLQAVGRETDEQLWAVISELPRLVGGSDRDGQTWTWAVRNRVVINEHVERARTSHQPANSPTPGQRTLVGSTR